jgi:hypothetical protein
MAKVRPIAILNLTGELTPELSAYFAERKVLVVDPLVTKETADWTHILTKDIHDFALINKTYDLERNDIHLVSLSRVNDVQNFTLNNGNLILDDIWMKNPIGSFILDKYFQGYGGISLGDNYPTFEEVGSFNITNPFNTGEYLDRLVQKAFENGIEALTLKTYFDHLIMYVAGLKNKNKAGVPFEVTYGTYNDIFALQVHFFSERLELLDVSTCLSSLITKKPEEYLLNTAVQSSDFFDFSFMPDVNKVVITGLWTKDARIKYENRGLMFKSLMGGEALVKYESEGEVSTLVQESPLEDLSDKVTIPDSLPDEVLRKVQGRELPDTEATLVKAGTETEDEVKLIRGEDELTQVVNHVRGKVEEEKDFLRVAGNKLDIDKAAYRIASNVDESTKETNLKVRSLGDKLPATIKSGLFDFAKTIKKDVHDLDEKDLDSFQAEKLPEIIRQGLIQSERMLKAIDGLYGHPEEASAAQKQAEAEAKELAAENDRLKIQIKTLTSEVRILKETKARMAEMKSKAAEVAKKTLDKKSSIDDPDEELREHFRAKINEHQQKLDDLDQKKIGALLERESKLVQTAKEEEMRARKAQIEALQKETYLTSELEKAEQKLKSKDLIVQKTKESFTKLVAKKDTEILDLRQKIDHLTRALSSTANQSQATILKELEKQNQNLMKQIEVYKNKITSITENMQTSKSDDGSSREEVRKLTMVNTQLKNQLDISRKEIERMEQRFFAENAQMQTLKQEKARLEGILKKTTLEMVSAPTPVPSTPLPNESMEELKRLQAHAQILETQLKDSATKIVTLEQKLAEALKPQKMVEAGGSNVKISQLENSVKKLTQDLVENKNQLAEAKKETNKLRQEKTALQNQFDKLKKESEKSKAAAPKKSGKAA